MKKIDFMIIGIQKAATSSLANYLAQHPDICKHKSNEMPYFTLNEEYYKGYKFNYEKYFYHCSAKKKILAKSVTVIQSLESIKRLYEHNKDMKLVLVLRNPVDRAHSAFWYAKRMGWENLDSFEEALEQESIRREKDMIKKRITRYKENGKYAIQIKQLFNIFPKEQVFILLQEDIIKDANSVCQNIFSFFNLKTIHELNITRSNESAVPRILFINKLFYSNNPIKKKIKQNLPILIQRIIDRSKEKIISFNEKKVKNKKMDLETRKQLISYYKDMNIELEKLINRDLSHWNQIK